MLAARLPLYQEVATIVVQTDDLSVDEVAAAIVEKLGWHERRLAPTAATAPVGRADRAGDGAGRPPAAPYDVVIGRGLLDELVAAAAATGASRAALIHPPTLAATAEVIRDAAQRTPGSTPTCCRCRTPRRPRT